MVSIEQMVEGEYNPGEQIRHILGDALELESYDKPTIANDVDRALGANGRLAELMRESAIDYATRRLIIGAVHLAASGNWEPSDPGFLSILRRYLREHTGLDKRTQERLLPFLQQGVRLNRSTLSTGKRKSLRNEKRAGGETKCYVCGREMDFTDLNKADGATADHVWPRSLGGLNERSNLRLACQRCNGIKDDTISGADYHYERFVRADDKLTNAERMIAWQVQGLACAQCGRDPSQIGELFLVRDDETDCWHVHNVTAYCNMHLPKR